MPHDLVSARIYSAHRHWLSTPSPTGRARNDGSRRDIRHRHLDGYEDAWRLLESAKARETPFVGHAWILDVVRDHGLPENHPWRRRFPASDQAIFSGTA